MKSNIVVIGAGPAGLACAWRLTKGGQPDVSVMEKDSVVGGLAKTITLRGYRFDIGGHRFYTKWPEVLDLYDHMIGRRMLRRPRLSRIYFDGKYFAYPLVYSDVLTKIGILRAGKLVASYITRKLHPYKTEKTFTEWVANRFGDGLFETFFKSYTEKVWGIPTDALSADWAAQRIQDFSLTKAVLHAFTAKKQTSVRTLISSFRYPATGPGFFYEAMRKKIVRAGGRVRCNERLVAISTRGNRIVDVTTERAGKKMKYPVGDLVSTMPLTELLGLLNPSKKVLRATRALRFRHFISVNLVLEGNPFPDNWIYIHDPKVRVGRVQNFANWSPHMTKNKKQSPIGMEYFCDEGDKLWKQSDKELIVLAKKEAKEIGLFDPARVLFASVCRVRDAYPVYSVDYEKPLAEAKKFVERFENLYLCGRGGLYRYNNMDHSIMTGFAVADDILSRKKRKSPWHLADEDEYLEGMDS